MNDMKLNKTILDTILKLLLNFDNGDIEFNKSNLSKITNKNIKDNIWLSDNTVDLDLPSGTLWCKHNLGATYGDTKESWYGNYYAWGEIEPKTKYSKKNYTYKGNSKILPLENDAVYLTNNLLRIPTKEQIEELMDHTTSKWVKNYKGINGLNGRVFTSKTNDNSIFIPAAGYYNDSDLIYAGSHCYLWSSSLILDYDYYYYFWCSSKYIIPNEYCFPYRGFSVRGVSI